MRDILPSIPGDATVAELEAASAKIERAVARLIASGEGGPACCPRCGSRDFVRKGRDADGTRRYLCRGCGRTFTARTGSLLSNPRLPPEKWRAFASCMASRAPLRDTAARVGVSLATAWFMRMRVCEALSRTLGPFASGRGVEAQVDGTLVAESPTGRHRRRSFSMPRAPRSRGGQVPERGVSGEQPSVVCGANDRGGAFLELAGRGRRADAQVARALRGRIAPGTAVATDMHGAYVRLLPGMGARHEAFKSGAPEAKRRLAVVNSPRSRLKAFLAPFRGVSSRRLVQYLWWFAWTARTVIGAEDAARSLFGRECEGSYSLTRSALWDAPFPFAEYWGMSK